MSTAMPFKTLPFLIGTTLSMGCSDDDSSDLSCGGNGEMHGTHCHCDAGFELNDDGSSCEEAQNTDGSENNGGFSFEPQQIQSVIGTENSAPFWILEAIDDDVQLKIEIYESFGGLSSPGSLIINDDETNYATCGTCLILQTGCAIHGDHYHCSRTFMPSIGGEIKIENIGRNAGEDFTGELLDIEFQEVSIGQNYQTEPVEGGQILNLVSWAFDTQLEAQ